MSTTQPLLLSAESHSPAGIADELTNKDRRKSTEHWAESWTATVIYSCNRTVPKGPSRRYTRNPERSCSKEFGVQSDHEETNDQSWKGCLTPPRRGPWCKTDKEAAAQAANLQVFPRFRIKTWDFFHQEVFLYKGQSFYGEYLKFPKGVR